MRPAVVVCLLLFVGVCSGGYRWRYKSHEESGEDSRDDSDEDSNHDSYEDRRRRDSDSDSNHDSDSDEDDQKCDCSRRGGFRGDILRNRADHNDVEINRLFNAAWKLEKKLDKMGHGPDVRGLKARVDALTGNDCREGMFECEDRGGCIHPLQVCDYDYDCADHSDENDHTCKILPSEGSSWSAAVSHNTCFKEAADHIRVVIAKAERDEMMGSQVEVDVTTFLYTNDDKINVGHAHGYYHFGDRNLDVMATDGDIVELRCHYDGFDENSCHGKFYRHGEDEPCGYAVFVRE